MNEQSFEYRTGQTQPQKSSRGLIAVLLICVIFLCGLVSVLSLMNIRLLNKLRQAGTQTPLSFAEGDLTPIEPEGDSITLGGITLQELPDLYRQIEDLPQGLYVVDAPENGPVAPGDILIGFNRSAVGSLSVLNALQETCKAGQRIDMTFFRQGEDYFTHTITFGK
jgi:hypothetical protein